MFFNPNLRQCKGHRIGKYVLFHKVQAVAIYFPLFHKLVLCFNVEEIAENNSHEHMKNLRDKFSPTSMDDRLAARHVRASQNYGGRKVFNNFFYRALHKVY